MKKQLLLSALFLCLGYALQAQYTTSSPASAAHALLDQNPIAKATLIAAADDSIEERTDKFGQTYYLRINNCPWSGQQSYELVVFDPVSSSFLSEATYAQTVTPVVTSTQTEPEEIQQDSSCVSPRSLIPAQEPNKAKPRRSSTVKILAHKF